MLVTCPECSFARLSSGATKCPECGYTIDVSARKSMLEKAQASEKRRLVFMTIAGYVLLGLMLTGWVLLVAEDNTGHYATEVQQNGLIGQRWVTPEEEAEAGLIGAVVFTILFGLPGVGLMLYVRSRKNNTEDPIANGAVDSSPQ